jgi:hypothetical protein
VVSGTMANLVCQLVHCGRGDEMILGDQSHIFFYEDDNSDFLRRHQNILRRSKPCPRFYLKSFCFRWIHCIFSRSLWRSELNAAGVIH